MSLTVTEVDQIQAFGGLSARVFDVTFDDSYPTGGEPLSANDLRMQSIVMVIATPKAGYALEYDYANSKLLAYWVDNNAVADSAMIQVPDTTDLNPAITTARILVLGR